MSAKAHALVFIFPSTHTARWCHVTLSTPATQAEMMGQFQGEMVLGNLGFSKLPFMRLEMRPPRWLCWLQVRSDLGLCFTTFNPHRTMGEPKVNICCVKPPRFHVASGYCSCCYYTIVSIFFINPIWASQVAQWWKYPSSFSRFLWLFGVFCISIQVVKCFVLALWKIPLVVW